MEATRFQGQSRHDGRELRRFGARNPPATKMGKPVLKADEPTKDKAIVDSSWLALKAQRKANGLCFTLW